MASPWLQDVVLTGGVMSRAHGARAEGKSDEELKDRIRGWLRTYLTADEQQALCRLWLFKGGFQLEAAQTMLGSSDKSVVEATLRGLRGTSCLQLSTLPATDSSAARYSMHPVVRQVFKNKYNELPEPIQCSILEDYLNLLVTRMDGLEALRSNTHWPEVSHAMARELLYLQELLSVLRSSPPCCSAALSEDSPEAARRPGGQAGRPRGACGGRCPAAGDHTTGEPQPGDPATSARYAAWTVWRVPCRTSASSLRPMPRGGRCCRPGGRRWAATTRTQWPAWTAWQKR